VKAAPTVAVPNDVGTDEQKAQPVGDVQAFYE